MYYNIIQRSVTEIMIGQLKTYLVIEWEDANKTKIKKYRVYFEDQYREAHKYWSTLKYPKSIELTVLENV